MNSMDRKGPMSRLRPAVMTGIAAAAISMLACEGLQHKYVQQDKEYRIAFVEDARVFDSSLVSPEILGDPDPMIRAKAADAIARIGNDGYREALKANLSDTSAVAAEAKFFAAGMTGDTSFIAPLLALARSRIPARDAAVEALGRLSDSTQATELAAFLADPDTLVAYQAMLALWRSKGWSQAAEMARIAAVTPNRKVLYGALYALSRGGRREGIELFRRLIADADPEYRMLAYLGLGRAADTASIDLIAAGLRDRDHRVVANVITALGTFGDRGTVQVGQAWPSIQDEKLLALAIQTIGAKPYPNASGDIEKIFRADGRENIQAACAAALLLIDGPKAMALIDGIIPQPTSWERVNIAEGLGRKASDLALPRLRQFLTDAVPVVRATALEAICKVDSAQRSAYLSAALADSDYMVASTAVDLAAVYRQQALIPAIAGLYRASNRALDPDLKRSIIGAWATMTGDSLYDSGNDSLIIAGLEEGCNDEWFVIRKEAAGLLWDRFHIDRRGAVGAARSKVEKTNYRDLFSRYAANPTAEITTSRGKITIELFYDAAPMTVNNFISLAEQGFYNHRIFHRVLPNFVIQDGCPRGDGSGGPGYTIRCEYNRRPYVTGSVGMALSGKDTGGSQYFITLSPQPHLDARYTLFGQVTSGLDIVQQIVRGDSILNVTMQYSTEGQ